MYQNMNCHGWVWNILVLNPDQEFTKFQMQKVLKKTHKAKYSVSMIGWTLRKLHDEGIAERIRENGKSSYRYSLANTN